MTGGRLEIAARRVATLAMTIFDGWPADATGLGVTGGALWARDDGRWLGCRTNGWDIDLGSSIGPGHAQAAFEAATL